MKRIQGKLIAWLLLICAGVAGCLCDRSAKRFDDFDFDVPGGDDDKTESTDLSEDLRSRKD